MNKKNFLENELSAKDFAFGAQFSPADVRDYRLTVDGTTTFPEEFELPMVRIKNQGHVSSCVSFAISSVIEYHNKRQNNDPVEMSTGWIYGNRRDQMGYMGEGMNTRGALESIRAYGDVPYELFPYNIEVPTIIEMFEKSFDELAPKAAYSRFTTYYKVKTEAEIKKALMVDGPVVFAIKWYKDIKVENNIITSSQKGEGGGHCMVIYGWNKDGWKIQNSWGRWNGTGTAILPYDFRIKEAYGVTDDILDKREDIVKPYNTNFKKFIAKIINFFLNLKNLFKSKK